MKEKKIQREELRYLDAIAIAKLIINKGYSYQRAIEQRANERRRTTGNIRLNVTGNLNFVTQDWHDLSNGMKPAKSRIAKNLLKFYPEKLTEIAKIFSL